MLGLAAERSLWAEDFLSSVRMNLGQISVCNQA